MKSSKVLLIGGGGFIGGWLAARLAEDGIGCAVPWRRDGHAKWLKPAAGAEFLCADVHDPQVLRRLIDGVDAVVNLVGILHDRDSARPYGQGFAKAHVELPGKIAAAMREAGVRRLLHVSALRAALDAPSAYLRSKAAGEAALTAAEDIDLTIFRPSVVFGANDAFLNMFARMLRVFPVLPLAGAQARFQPVYVGDVAGALADSLARPETFGKIYELGGPQVYTLRRLVELTAAWIGKRRIVIGLPEPLALVQAYFLSLLPNPPMTPDNLRSMRLDNVCDGRHDYPGWRPTALDARAPAYLSGRR